MSDFHASVTLTIESLAFGGKGVARHDGKVWFVPFVIPGEKIEASPVRERKQFVEGRLVRIREASPLRTTPRCQYFGSCGGCSYQHIRYSDQLRFKTRQVEEALIRIGGIAAPSVLPMQGGNQDYGYRNRISVHTRDGKTGFYDQSGRAILDVTRCEIASDYLNQALEEFRQRRPRDGRFTLREPQVARGFQQTNPQVAELLRQEVLRRILAYPARRLLDAYCGSGFFAKLAAPHFQEVIGMDWSEASIRDARQNTQEGERYLQGATEDLLPTTLTPELSPETVVILDPPQEGLSGTVVQALLDAPARTLVYVSCNPATFARDVKKLSAAYALGSVQPFDMFPQTAEIELVATLLPKTPMD